MRQYTLIEDFQGLTIGSIATAAGMFLLRSAGLITGGTAGLALLVSYLSSWSFGAVFFWVNVPFYIFAIFKKGWVFTIKGFVSVTAVSLMVTFAQPYISITAINPLLAAVVFGIVAGLGILGLFRHGSSIGGTSMIGLVIQEKWGIQAGWVQMAIDGVLFGVALFLLPVPQVIYSFIGTAILSLVLALNHRKDWYIAG
ncbi:YitT family protein [Ketogulonicigenium robustum]|nr:YitT family protein [Ketogulonicigenium robustum]